MSANSLLPPEWALQSGVMLTWPHGYGDWAAFLPEVEAVFVELARQICMQEKLLIVCYDQPHQTHVLNLLIQARVNITAIKTYLAPSEDTWARDHGFITIYHNKKPILLDFIFNGWGGKYSAIKDNEITQVLHEQGAFDDLPLQSIPLVLEGGSIEVNGKGTLLTTKRCLLSPSRNPQLNQAQIEKILMELFGLQQILWLEHGYLEGDDTDSHIDTLARFIDEKTICYVSCEDENDPHYHELLAMKQELEGFKNPQGESFILVPLPLPEKIVNAEGKRLPATYANFLIINQAVLLPTYDDPADEIALFRLQKHFPNHAVIGISCLALIKQFGSLHCVTMQIPHGVM